MTDIAIEAGDAPVTEPAEDQAWIELATPTARLWARLFDTWLALGILSFLLGMVLALIYPAIFDIPLFAGTLGNILTAIIVLPFALMVDAVILSTFGTTLGKLLAGIRVETLDGRPVGRLAWRRDLLVYLHGFFLGLPLLNLFAMSQSRDHLMNDGATRWDAALGTRVVDRGGNGFRTVLVAALALTFNFGLTAFGKYAEYKQPEWDRAAIAENIPAMNEGLPRFLDDVTRFDRIAYRRDPEMLSLLHTLIHRDGSPVDPGELRALPQNRAALLADYCGPQFDGIRKLRLPVHYAYGFPDGQVAFETVFTPEDCARPPAPLPAPAS